jgi:predicted DNA-binding transcriptional regulator YafY
MVSSQVVCAAIQARQVVTFTYKFKVRTVEPHAVGYDSDGDLTLCGWQLAGGSGQDFRDFHLDKATSFSTTGTTFAMPRPGYNRNDPTLSRILCQL